ncbi:ead/Ea22-like family protein [Klebsiella variicola]|uniref:ead/Ea22-like family protein n=1 Tax=Klebsiella variicola TaxID=244366 RepID=UPI001E5BC069|nr:ead/Ea22-like family protein [Klebsiella variicola]MCE0393883.1 ead/Ea22-like family protein [Klebsiella variicola subsp. variicola]
MNDITELAQLRGRTVDYPYYLVKCDCGKIYPSSELSGGEPMGDSGDYSDCYCPHCGEGEEHFAECADPETAWKAQQDKIDALVEALEKAQQRIASQREYYEGVIADGGKRIAELESRTVKLPEPFKLAKSSSGLTYYFADDVDAALTDAGIKVEAE